MSEIRVTSVVGENGGDPVGLTTGFTVGPLTRTTGIGATITHQGHAQFAGVCTATNVSVASSVTASTFFGSGANLTGISAGITMADQWRLNTGGTLTSDGTTQFTANWERGDTNSQGYIGSAMTESSGIFTFPSTGIYWIHSQMSFKRNSGDNRFAQLQLNVTTDNGTYTNASSGFAIFPSAYNTTNAIANFIFDVTNTSTHKVKFSAYTNRSSVLFLANSTAYEGNSFIFLKLGDT